MRPCMDQVAPRCMNRLQDFKLFLYVEYHEIAIHKVFQESLYSESPNIYSYSIQIDPEHSEHCKM